MQINVDTARSLAKQYRHYFIGTDGAQQFNRVYTQRPNEINVDIFANDPRMRQVIHAVVPKLQEVAPIDLRADGLFGPTAVGTNFSELYTVSGCPMNPMTYNPSNNNLLREELNLCSDFVSSRHKMIFDELIKLRYAKHDGSLGKISKISGSGFPYFSHDVEFKVQHLNWLARHGDDVLNLAIAGDFSSLIKEHGVVLTSSSVLRTQAEGGSYSNGKFKPKERMVNDLEYALTNGAHGRRFVADKSVYVEGIYLQGGVAGRARSAYSVPNPINTMFTTVVEGLRHYGDNEYEFTYKHRTKEELKLKAGKFSSFLPLDVGQYDQSIPWFLVERWLEIMPFSERARKVIALLLKAPKFYSAVGPDHDPIFTGDPENLDSYTQWGGLPSGAFLTSMLGKDMFTFAVLCMFDNHYHDVVGNIDSILRGIHKYGLFNASDDTIILANDKSFITKLVSIQTDKGSMSPYFKVEIEAGFKFLGNCGYVDKSGELRFCSDIGSFFKNSLCPERGIRSKLRKYAMYGLMIRREVFQDHPLFFELEEVFMKSFYDVFHVHWYDIINRNMVLPSVISKDETLSQADIEVLLDPSKLYYKYETEDVANSIVNNVEERISQENTDLLTKVLLTI